MRLLKIFLAVVIMSIASAACAEEMDGFRSFKWGASISEIRAEEPQLIEGLMGAMPGVKAFKRIDEDLNYGGIKADTIIYTFFKERFTSVSIEFRGIENFEKLLAYCKKQFGPVSASAVLKQEQYASFDSPRTGAMLLYQLSMQTSNYGRLYLYSKDHLE